MHPHYRFNISLKGSHLFCTGDTCYDEDHAKRLFELFQQKFPKKDGYLISCTYWAAKGKPIDNLSN